MTLTLTAWQQEVIYQALVNFQDEAVKRGFSPIAKQQLADLATKIGGDWRYPVAVKH